MESDAAKARTINIYVENIKYSYNKSCDCKSKKDIFLAALVLLFEKNICDLGNTKFDNEFSKLINDLSFGVLIKSFDEIGDGIFIRRMYLHDAIVKIKIENDIVTIIGFYSENIIPYDERYMFS